MDLRGNGQGDSHDWFFLAMIVPGMVTKEKPYAGTTERSLGSMSEVRTMRNSTGSRSRPL